MLRALLLRAADSPALRRLANSWQVTHDLAMRFVAGETLDDGLAAARALAEQGRAATLDYLGEKVTDAGLARAACKAYLEALEAIADEGLDCGVSVKPTQMGLHVDPGLCRDLLAEIARAAERAGAHVTLDMEGSDVTAPTVALVETLHAAGHRNVGCAVQTYLRRTGADVQRLSALPASLRLCKGAYAEPETVAFQARRNVDEQFAACAAWLLAHGEYPRLATHDHLLIRHAQRVAAELGRRPDEFEFQMLYGVRRPLQAQLVADGYRLRVYVPFGTEWYPYFTRRIGERPANLVFFLRQLGGD